MTLKPENHFAKIIPDRIMRSVFTVGTAATIGQVLLMLYSFIIARWLGPEKYGVIVANFSICAITSVLINFGLDTWLLRKDAKGEELKRVSGHVIAIKLLAGVLWGVLLWGFLPFIRPNIYFRSVLVFAIFTTILDAATNVLYMVLYKDENFKISAIIFISDLVLRLLSAIILILFNVVDICIFISVRLVIDALFFLVAWFIVRPIMNLQANNIRKKIMTDSMPYTASNVITVVYHQADVNLVSLLTDDVSMISFFSVAINLVNAIFSIIETLQNVFIPTISDLFEKRSKKLTKSILLSLAGFAIIGSIFWAGTSAFGEQFVNLAMGKAYLLSGVYLQRISPIFLIRSLTVGVTIILISVNLQKSRITPQVISTVVKIILGVMLFTALRINGLLWAYILAEVTLLIGLLWVLMKWFHKTLDRENNSFQV